MTTKLSTLDFLHRWVAIGHALFRGHFKELMFLVEPDFVIGSAEAPYLHRVYLTPPNWFFKVYVHKFYGSDDARALHDHPWSCASLLLHGQYLEHLEGGVSKLRKKGSWVFRLRGSAAHRIELIKGPVLTLFFMGPKYREWGFRCPKGWIHWKRFTKTENPGETGPGCGE